MKDMHLKADQSWAETIDTHITLRIECAKCGTPLLHITHETNVGDRIVVLRVMPCPRCEEERTK